MKKAFALVLTFALVMSLGVVAFAAASPTGATSGSTKDLGWGSFTVPVPAKKATGEVHGADDKIIATVDPADITQIPVGESSKLSPEDEKAFLAAYEEAKAIEGKTVKYFYWIDIPEEFKTDDFTWFRFDFKCAGENVEVTVNGHPMEVVHVEGVDYYAKLTEFGAVAIMCD